MENRSSLQFPAYALVDNNGKLALFSGDVSIFWLRKVATAEAAKRNANGFRIHVERVTIVRKKCSDRGRI